MRGWLAAGWLAVALAVPVGAQAAESRGFTIAPAFQPVAVPADRPQVPVTVRLTSHLPADQTFRLSVLDFGSLDEQGGVAFLGQPASELEHRYGLASWMTLEKDLLVVPAGKAIDIRLTIDNRPSLAPGGHYGAVLATAVTETGQPITDPRVGVRQVLSSLVLVTKAGGEERDLRLVSQTVDGGWARLPRGVEQRFQNAGNVHLVPRGVVEVRDGVGRVVKRGALNDGSLQILPESFRRYKTSLLGVAPAWLPGRYQVTTTYRYDGSEQTKTLTTSVWYVGSLVIWVVCVGAVLAGVILALWLFWWRPRRRRLR